MSSETRLRRSGILLHPSSLPSAAQGTCVRSDCFRFIDFLHEAGFAFWQVLPLGPVDPSGSPYNSISAFAGTTKLFHDTETFDQSQFHAFCAQHHLWLDEYCLFILLSEKFRGPWNEWPEAYRIKDGDTLQAFKDEHVESLKAIKKQQYVFYKEWLTVKAYAQNKGIKLIGDLPIFVSYNSADVWSNQDLFLLNEAGNPCFVTGVPPDYFSETGQRWGNPHYNWSHHQATGYQWWISRITHVLKLYDLVRIDHFRGFESCWQIPLESESAVEGRWVAGPGSDFFEALKKPFPNLPFIAEDLGIITDEVLALRKHFHLPGMAILQFAFDSDANNLYLPHNLDKNTVVYTGTHDNDTTLGWYSKLGSKLQDHISNYLSWPNEDQPWPIIKAALASVADTAIIPMQDVLALGTEARMNVPGTVEGNWRWHFEWDQISEELPGYLNKLNRIYGRMNTD